MYGIGGGNSKIIACPEGTTNLVRSQMGLGAVVYQGTGFVYLQNVTRFSNQMLTVFLGQVRTRSPTSSAETSCRDHFLARSSFQQAEL